MKIDIIGDIHGCYQELRTLVKKLGYIEDNGKLSHPENNKNAFLGDLTDRGPDSLSVINFVDSLVKQKIAFYTPGNHCNKLYRFFLGNKVQISHGLETTVAEYESLIAKQKHEIREKFISLYEAAPLYLVLDDGKLIIAHAGIKEDLIGLHNKKVKTFVLYGDISGEKHEDGSPVRRDWAKHYKGKATIVYGHTPVETVRVINHTYNIDTGAVFGGKLTALRYPSMEIIQVPSSMPLLKEKFKQFP
ncbi:bis(5'-nucleosyl)-tetraphosphatase PrpE [Caldibacillus lycopersici]|uniref:Bis(5'-nucleosyl)-tetraphosphatase PrpE n=1 Tax=Perspicuibacillus lycopersici TaxID=1325689 RepID=A0AAE3IS75_9BACI|nr:bis(5'-nucleosyl)-tetraphosphatase PrpE [Perspicuibacillus lycopersici]MCU9612426.1 bis(5'-nucleosyl)-tetraphosphatase PrpE [Perspicuibacillus lycopersici]